MLKSLLSHDVKVDITIDHIRLRSNLTTSKTIRYIRNFFFYTILGFTQSLSESLGDIEGFNQNFPGSYKSNKPINITGNDKVHLKYDCINESILKGI